MPYENIPVHLVESNVPPMLFAAVLTEYRRFIASESCGLAFTTQRDYASASRRFYRFLKSEIGRDPLCSDINPIRTRRYFALFAETHTACSYNSTRAALHKLCAYLVAEGHLAHNPLADMRPRPVGNISRPVPEPGEVTRLMDAAKHIFDPARRAFSCALLSMSVYGGLRRFEILALKVGDVDFGDESLLIRHGKGDKERRIFPHTDCIGFLRDYLSTVRAPDCAHDYLFAQNRARRLGDDGLRLFFRDIAERAGFQISDMRRLTPHPLRRALATRMLEGGVDIHDVKAFLGHASIATTEKYIVRTPAHMNALRDAGALSPASAPPQVPTPDTRHPTPNTAAPDTKHRNAAWRAEQFKRG